MLSGELSSTTKTLNFSFNKSKTNLSIFDASLYVVNYNYVVAIVLIHC